MDYSKINKIKVDGDGNFVFQDIHGSDITVNYNNTAEFNRILTQANNTLLSEIINLLSKHQRANPDFEEILKRYLDLPPEIRQKKNQISQRVEELKRKVQILISGEASETDFQADKFALEGINFQELIESIDNGTCVLFIGPELSVDSDGNSLHEKYFQSLNDSSLFYDAREGLFHPGEIYKLFNNSPKYYETTFPEINKNGYAVLHKLAQIPFGIIVSYCPDDTICRIFSKYNIEYQFLVYNETELSTVEIDWYKPIIYNALGCLAQKKGKYILTHQQLNSYIEKPRKIKIPVSLEDKIQGCSHYIFIGFDFDKWYYRLLLFLFRFDVPSKRLAFEQSNRIENINRIFIKKQFGIDFENSRYEDFAGIILRKSNEAGISRSLYLQFANSMLKELENIWVRSVDSKKLEELKELNDECDEIENKLILNS